MDKHTQKVKIARKLLTKREIKLHRPLFSSLAWDKRKEEIEARVNRKETKAKEVSKIKKEKKNGKSK